MKYAFLLFLCLFLLGCNESSRYSEFGNGYKFKKYADKNISVCLPGDDWKVSFEKGCLVCFKKYEIRSGKVTDGDSYSDKILKFTVQVDNKSILCHCGGMSSVIERELNGNKYNYFMFQNHKLGGQDMGSMKAQLGNGYYLDSHDLPGCGIGEIISQFVFESIVIK